MEKLITIAIDLGALRVCLYAAIHNLHLIDNNDIPRTLAAMIFLWEELEKEKKKYMRKRPYVYFTSFGKKRKIKEIE